MTSTNIVFPDVEFGVGVGDAEVPEPGLEFVSRGLEGNEGLVFFVKPVVDEAGVFGKLVDVERGVEGDAGFFFGVVDIGDRDRTVMGVDEEVPEALGEEENEALFGFFGNFLEEEVLMLVCGFVVSIFSVSLIIALCRMCVDLFGGSGSKDTENFVGDAIGGHATEALFETSCVEMGVGMEAPKVTLDVGNVEVEMNGES